MNTEIKVEVNVDEVEEAKRLLLEVNELLEKANSMVEELAEKIRLNVEL